MQHCHHQSTAATTIQQTTKKAETAAAANIHNWLILDGTMQAEWTDSLNTLLDDCRTLMIPNAHATRLPGEIFFL